MAQETRRLLDHVKAMNERREGPPPDAPKYLNHWVYYLLQLNYHYAKDRADPELVKAEFRRVIAGLTKGAKGRPRTITEAQAQEAKRLREDGWSYGRIAKHLNLGDARRVRTALEHHYPQKKSD
jgi:hypothetical protein